MAAAEAFILRNGYTAAGHPNGLPVLVNDIWDNLRSAEEVAESRRGSVQPQAFVIAGSKLFGYSGLFKPADRSGDCSVPTNECMVVHVAPDGSAHVSHQQPRFATWLYKENER